MTMNAEAAALMAEDMRQAAMTQEEQQRALETAQLLERLERRRITPDKELPKMDFLFRIFHKPCFPRGELVALSGKAKSGKTFVSSILMALCFRSQVLSFERIEPERLHVLWYDTEQSEESTQDILRNRIIPMTGVDEASFPMELLDIFNVRIDGYDKRLPMLEVAVHHYKPDLVILDGVRDLVADINDGITAQDCIERLMRLASEERCCIVCVLHQNKSTEDKNLRGWIGTELKNKAFEVYECCKSSGRIFALGQTDTRKYDILDTLKFAVPLFGEAAQRGTVPGAAPSSGNAAAGDGQHEAGTIQPGVCRGQGEPQDHLRRAGTVQGVHDTRTGVRREGAAVEGEHGGKHRHGQGA